MAKSKSSNEGSGGKLVDTWIYEYAGITEDDRQRVAPKKVPIELRLIKKFTGDTPPLATGEVCFALICKEAEISMRGSDIEALRAAMWEKLDTKYEVKWERYYLVSIRHQTPYEGVGTGMVFQYEDVDKGVAWDGTLLLRQHRYRGQNEIRPWPGEFKDKQGTVLACIPATPANTKALRQFRDRIDELRERLADFLRPGEILRTLAGLNGMTLLPPSTKTDDDCDMMD
jgi:hypothetical protein